MKKKTAIAWAVVLVVIAAAAGAVWWNTPVRFLRGTDPGAISRIEVFDGNTGVGFTIEDSRDISYIVSNIQSAELRRERLSLGYMGTMFRLSFYDGDELSAGFIVNSSDTIRDDPFFYRDKTGSLCVDYLRELEGEVEEN